MGCSSNALVANANYKQRLRRASTVDVLMSSSRKKDPLEDAVAAMRMSSGFFLEEAADLQILDHGRKKPNAGFWAHAPLKN